MFTYALGILPMIELISLEYPDLCHTWVADDGKASGPIDQLCALFQWLKKLGPEYGFKPNASKSILIVPAKNFDSAEQFLSDNNCPNFNLTTGHRYLGGFIGDQAPFEEWLADKVSTWVSAIQMISKASKNYPQSAFCGLQKSLQMEWQFLQRVKDCPADAFRLMEKEIANNFLKTLFEDDPPPRSITSLPVKLGGLGIMDPTKSCSHNYHTSSSITEDIVKAILEDYPFSLRDYSRSASEAKAASKESLLQANISALETALSSPTANTPSKRIIDRAKSTGIWLSIVPMTSTKSTLSSLEFCDALHLRYGMTPSNLPTHCDGCHAPFSVQHALTCKKGGLVTLRHNELRDELRSIATNIFPPSAIRVEPLIHPVVNTPQTTTQVQTQQQQSQPPTRTQQHLQSPIRNSNTQSSHSSQHQSSNPTSQNDPSLTPPNDMRGDLLIRGLFDRAKDCIIDVSISDLDCQSYFQKTAAAVLRSREKDKKRKYSAACAKYRRDFLPFITSADGLLGHEATALLQLLSSRLAERWDKPYPPVRGFLNLRVSLALVRASHLCIRGSRLSIGAFSPEVADDTVLGSFHLLRS